MPAFTEYLDFVGPRAVAPPGMHDPNAFADLTGAGALAEHSVGPHITCGRVLNSPTVVKINHPLVTPTSVIVCQHFGEKAINPAAPATRRWAGEPFAGYFEIYGSGANARPIDWTIEKF